MSKVSGAVAACTCGFTALLSIPLGVVVWILAERDLRRMKEGLVDSSGDVLTRQARFHAMAGVAFGSCRAAFYICLYWFIHS